MERFSSQYVQSSLESKDGTEKDEKKKKKKDANVETGEKGKKKLEQE